MPCKTVMFAMDSTFLTALNYQQARSIDFGFVSLDTYLRWLQIASDFFSFPLMRQMIGRAGRRGFDMIGEVIHFGIPLTKILRLQVARTPSLRVRTHTLSLCACSTLRSVVSVFWE